jgi:hypothetical protein
MKLKNKVSANVPRADHIELSVLSKKLLTGNASTFHKGDSLANDFRSRCQLVDTSTAGGPVSETRFDYTKPELGDVRSSISRLIRSFVINVSDDAENYEWLNDHLRLTRVSPIQQTERIMRHVQADSEVDRLPPLRRGRIAVGIRKWARETARLTYEEAMWNRTFISKEPAKGQDHCAKKVPRSNRKIRALINDLKPRVESLDRAYALVQQVRENSEIEEDEQISEETCGSLILDNPLPYCSSNSQSRQYSAASTESNVELESSCELPKFAAQFMSTHSSMIDEMRRNAYSLRIRPSQEESDSSASED